MLVIGPLATTRVGMLGLRLSVALGAFLAVVQGAFALPAASDSDSDSGSSIRGRPGSKSGLNLAAKAAKKLYLGTATNADQWNDTTYYSLLRDNAEFGQITAANVMKWVRRGVASGSWVVGDLESRKLTSCACSPASLATSIDG